ncbi:hypothetical protein PAEPH01_0654 [Pancytospora epiphaga]|nr:hypothetical protein PAEPH01_0654 [Pancytospora epiphaga]
MVITYFLFISTVLGILTIDELRESVDGPFSDSNSNIYINPNGPLNFIHGHVSYENRLLHKKRLFSPGFNINYSLTETKDKSLFQRNTAKDAITEFEISDNEDTSKYLSQYHETVRTMYNIVNGEANIQTNRDDSLFRFLTQELDKEDCFKLLAIMLLLAEGVDLPVELIEKTIDLDGSQVKSMNMQVLVYKGNVKLPLKIEIYNMIKGERKNDQEKVYVEEICYTFKEVVSLIKFFIDYGGKNKKKVDVYNLGPHDTLSFLIQSYMFEFIQNINEARLFFKVVNDLLVNTMNEKGSEIWKVFFTEDSNEAIKCKPIYEAFEKINDLILETGFPFSIHTPPPSGMIINICDRENRMKTTDNNSDDDDNSEDDNGEDNNINDDWEIAIYALFCCLLYDPISNKYKLDHLDKNGYTPSEGLRDFFTKICPSPEDCTSLYIHQQWARVVQDLVLSEGELMGEEATGVNTIEYCYYVEDVSKGKKGVSYGIAADILNVLKVVAKVSGMPRKRLMELGNLSRKIQNEDVDKEDIKESVEKYATKIFNELSTMNVNVDISEIRVLFWTRSDPIYDESKLEYVLTSYEQMCILGNLKINFTPKNDNSKSMLGHVVQFLLEGSDASTTVISNRNEIKEEDKGVLKALTEKCKEMKSDLGRMGMNKIQEFLNKGKFKPVPPEMVEKVEQACNDIERYLAINNILNSRRMETINDKLYLIDLFAPYLNEITKGDSSDTEEQTSKEMMLDFINTLAGYFQEILNKAGGVRKYDKKLGIRSSDPLIYLISNILGSVPLEDEATQFFFVQIFASCNGKYKELFPNICGDVRISPELNTLSVKYIPNYLFLRLFHECDTPNMIIKLYNRVRRELGDLFFKSLRDHNQISYYLYNFVVKKCVKLNCLAGIKAIKDDFGIYEGKMAFGKDMASRFNVWIDTVLMTGCYEVFEEVCMIWKDLLKERKNTVKLIFLSRAEVGLRIRWGILFKRSAPKKLYTNEAYIKVLLEIGLYCIHGLHNINCAYELFTSHFTLSLCESLLSSFENIIEDIEEYLLTLENSYGKINTKLPSEDSELFDECSLWLIRVKYFVKRIGLFVKRLCISNAKPENREKFKDIKKRIVKVFNDVRMLRKYISRFRKLQKRRRCNLI